MEDITDKVIKNQAKNKEIKEQRLNEQKQIVLINEKLKNLPKNPGVYLMKDKHSGVIYVGKAINLKNRVTQYFRKNNKTTRIEKLVSNIVDFEYIITTTEAEALILENLLIKKYKPKYNVLLKDDKTYPCIKIDYNEMYPKLRFVRKVDYTDTEKIKYFGPYPSSYFAKEIIEILSEKYKLRFCEFDQKGKFNEKSCFYSQIDRCDGICTGKVSEAEYIQRLKNAIKVLKGKTDEIINILNLEMQEYSEKLEFEKAGQIRDRIEKIKNNLKTQKITNFMYNTIDAIGFAQNEEEKIIVIFEVRANKLENRRKIYFKQAEITENETEFINDFVKQYYIGKKDIPNKIMIRQKIKDVELIQEVLSKELEHSVRIIIPQKGEKLKFVELADANAQNELIQRVNLRKEKLEKISKNISEDVENYELLLELKEKLKLEKIPLRIESYDISNLGSTDIVGAMCVLKNGKIEKKEIRRFKVTNQLIQDDYSSMKEVIEKRINHTISGKTGLRNNPRFNNSRWWNWTDKCNKTSIKRES